jgi:hypothetical protein
MLYIYILKLESNKYYIGKTSNPQFRLEEHFDGSASVWTHKYKPVKLIEFIADCDNFDEDKYTLKYMEKYGIDNVRGGSFCEIILNKENMNTIKRMITGSTDKCYICGMSGHFVSECKQNNLDFNKILEKCFVGVLYDNNLCFRCFRSGHQQNNCFELTTKSGEIINDKLVWVCRYCEKEFYNEKKCESHENNCKSKFKSNIKSKLKSNANPDTNNYTCYRCGRPGHKSPECYAKTTVDGDDLDSSDSSDSSDSLSNSDDYEEVFCCDNCGKKYGTLKGLTCHQNLYCKKSNSNKTNKKTDKKTNKNCCYRCGRPGHYEDDCFASTHVKGYVI